MLEKNVSGAKSTRKTLEIEATSFLLGVASLFFLLEGIIHYSDFFITAHEGNNSLVPVSLILGSIVIGLLYFLLACLCLQNQGNAWLFAFVAVFAGLLSISYFIIEIVESLGPKFYFFVSFNYVQFITGYGSITILIELLIVFFSYRVFKTLST